MSRRQKVDYRSVFSSILELVPRCKVKRVVADFEAAAWSALKDTMRQSVEVKGCFFHFTQCIFRKIKSLNLTRQYKEDEGTRLLCQNLMALLLLPKENIIPAFNLLIEGVNEGGCLQLCEYFRKVWINGSLFKPESWCWFLEHIRTNNDTEGWHHRFNVNSKVNMPLYKMIDALGAEVIQSEVHIDQFERGELRRNQRKEDIRKEERLKKHWERFDNNEIDWRDLLKKVSRTIKKAVVDPTTDDNNEWLFAFEPEHELDQNDNS